MGLTPDLLRLLEDSATTASAWHQIASPLRKIATSVDDPPYVLASAFDYLLQIHRRDARDRHAATFEPMLRMVDGETIPPVLETIDDEWLDLWQEAAEAVSAPALRARLHDLLAERRHGAPHEHVRQSVMAYRELALGDWHAIDRADALVRALELARRFSLDSEAAGVLREMVVASAQSLRATEPEPGVTLSILRALADDRHCPEEVDEQLEFARQIYRGAHLAESVIEIQRQRAQGDGAGMRQLARERVEAWLDEAESSDGLVKVVHLETAARLARDAALQDLHDTAKRRLQAVPKEDLELQRVSAESTLPEEVVSEYLAPFTQAPSVQDALVAFVSHPPSLGDVSENRAAVERSRIEFPIQHLFPRVRLGGDGLPRWSPSSDEEREDGDLAHQELLRFQVVGSLLARGLWLVGENLHPAQEEVESFIGALPNQPKGLASLLAGAFDAYWREDWTASLFMALPAVEALCRNLVLSLERGIYETQRGRRPGQYPGLAALLRWMRDDGLDESWFRYAWTLLASPAGLNLRNEVAHGFVFVVGPQHAAAALHLSVYLAALHVDANIATEPAVQDET